MPDNLPSAKKPVIQKTPPTTIKVPAPVHTDAAEEAGEVSVWGDRFRGARTGDHSPHSKPRNKVKRGQGLSGTSGSPGPLHLTLQSGEGLPMESERPG